MIHCTANHGDLDHARHGIGNALPPASTNRPRKRPALSGSRGSCPRNGCSRMAVLLPRRREHLRPRGSCGLHDRDPLWRLLSGDADSCRTANAVARGTVKVLRIPQAEVNRLLAASPRFTMNLLKIVSAKLAEATSERAFRYRNENRLMAAFNSHLAPDITSRLLAQGDDYGRPRLINGVALFADIRGFTKASLGLSPTELAHQLSDLSRGDGQDTSRASRLRRQVHRRCRHGSMGVPV